MGGLLSGRLITWFNYRTLCFCVQFPEIGSEWLPSALVRYGCHNKFYHPGGFNDGNLILSQSRGQKQKLRREQGCSF